jgi:chromosome partitioning protein
MILSLISQKGGVGKSAIARLLAVEFTKAGWSVKSKRCEREWI